MNDKFIEVAQFGRISTLNLVLDYTRKGDSQLLEINSEVSTLIWFTDARGGAVRDYLGLDQYATMSQNIILIVITIARFHIYSAFDTN